MIGDAKSELRTLREATSPNPWAESWRRWTEPTDTGQRALSLLAIERPSQIVVRPVYFTFALRNF
jgi:hypothetical protein